MKIYKITFLIQIISSLLDKIAEYDQTLVFENVPINNKNPLGSIPVEFKKFFNLLNNNSRVGFNLNVGHANIYNNIGTFIRKLNDKWNYTHLNDNQGKTDEHILPYLYPLIQPLFYIQYLYLKYLEIFQELLPALCW